MEDENSEILPIYQDVRTLAVDSEGDQTRKGDNSLDRRQNLTGWLWEKKYRLQSLLACNYVATQP